MASLNKVFLMGNLTRDPELRYTPSGTAVTDLGLAVNRTWSGKDGDRKEEVLFVDVTVWERRAETCCQYLKKGSSIHVEGTLKMDSWDDKTTGEKKSKIKVIAERVEFLDRKEGSPSRSGSEGEGEYPAPAARRPATGGGGYESRTGSNGANRSAPAPAPSSAPRRPTPPPPPESDDDEEDIPF